jgi:hypothetical protein
MPENAGVGIITFDQLQVRAADPRLANFDEGFVRLTRRRDIPQIDPIVFKPDCIHALFLGNHPPISPTILRLIERGVRPA